MIRHFEAHVVHSPQEAELLTYGGLPALHLDTDWCAHCGAEVGAGEEKFRPLAVVLEDEHIHFLCMSCAAPLTKPKS